jgi:hypothetical protein
MDLLRHIRLMREFYEREGYYPSFGHAHREETRPENPEPSRPEGKQFLPHKRRRSWK